LKKESNLIRKMSFNTSTLKDISHTLIETQDALPNNTQQLQVHQQVSLSFDHLKKLELTFPNLKTTKFISCFVDTKNFNLARANMWLIYQDGNWTLKSCHSTSTNMNFIIFHSEQIPPRLRTRWPSYLACHKHPSPSSAQITTP